jgi:hypothetical protein
MVFKKDKSHIRVGVCVLYYGLFRMCVMILSLTEKAFHQFCKVIPLATHWIHMWSYQQSAEERQDMDIGCNCLATVAWD